MPYELNGFDIEIKEPDFSNIWLTITDHTVEINCFLFRHPQNPRDLFEHLVWADHNKGMLTTPVLHDASLFRK